MTILEKILAAHSIPSKEKVRPGDVVRVHVDTAGNYSLPLPEHEFLKIWNPDRIWMVDEHTVPCYDVISATEHVKMREFARKHGIRWIEHGRQGICHQLAGEIGFHLPGCIYAFPDSHTLTGGAFNCACTGIGPIEIARVMATGETWYYVLPTVKFNLVGNMLRMIMTRDIMLYICGNYPPFTNRSVEYSGSIADGMSLDGRRSITCGSVEAGFDFALFKANQEVMDYVKDRTPFPELINPVEADEDAKYANQYTIDVTDLEPQVACPHDMTNVVPVSSIEKRNVKTDLAFVGACINGRLEDIKMVAEIVRGKKIHEDVRLIVTPASQEIFREAVRLGYAYDISAVGGIFTASRCAPCEGGNLGSGEVAVTSSTRNFKGRMGHPDSFVYCASPATVAASALTGVISDPRNV